MTADSEAISSSIWMHGAAEARQQARHGLGDLGGRGDGVAGEEVAAAEQRAVGAGHVALGELLARSEDRS